MSGQDYGRGAEEGPDQREERLRQDGVVESEAEQMKISRRGRSVKARKITMETPNLDKVKRQKVRKPVKPKKVSKV